MPEGSTPHPNIALIRRSVDLPYLPRSPGRSRKLQIKQRERMEHARMRLAELQSLEQLVDAKAAERLAEHLADISPGITIEFQSAQGFDLAFESLDLRSQGIELLNVRERSGVWYAAVFVPDGKLAFLKKRVSDYLESVESNQKIKNARLVDSIESIGRASLQALWTDEAPMPDTDAPCWWEVWLRKDGLSPAGLIARLNVYAERFGLRLSQQRLDFPERLVVTLRAKKTDLVRAVDLLNLFAEIRHADKPPAVSDRLTSTDQDELVESVAGRLEPADPSVSITLLDTGVARLHPLLHRYVSDQDMLTVDPSWGVADHDGHGTKMAGLALFGDLRDHAAHDGPVQPTCLLESVKTLAPAALADERPPLGSIAQQAVYAAEINEYDRKRVFCKAVTSDMHRDGTPSSYSAALDQVASGDSGIFEPRLIVVSAGNTSDALWAAYPSSNYDNGVEQPAQAWNVLTVGAYTERIYLPPSVDFAGWKPLANAGDLSPHSLTSRGWEKRWPNKPEVLFEGGNVAVNTSGNQFAMPTTMELLTTGRSTTANPLAFFSMTSAATALAAKFCASVRREYPDYWPETVRALAVHWADWTPAQVRAHLPDDRSHTKRLMLQTCGYGVVNQSRAFNGSEQRVTLIAQEELQPYKLNHSGNGAMNEYRVFELPWPRDLLEQYAEAQVELRVTLSYFIEPNPSNRGWVSKYKYASHGLRFSMQRLNESVTAFARRTSEAMNKVENDDPSQRPLDDSRGWLLGEDLRSAGSIHSDRWTGSAVDLANRTLIAVYPVVGWWRERKQLDRVLSKARFSLLVSLGFKDSDAPLYTAVANELTLEPRLLTELVNFAEMNRAAVEVASGDLKV